MSKTTCNYLGGGRPSYLAIPPIAHFVLCLCLSEISQGQIAPIISSGLNTEVSGPINAGGKTQFNITGGTRPGVGENLFHGFGEFSVPTNHIANFLNDSGIATSNILSRVTGDNPSAIFGKIQTTGFDNANLFLMNPNGIVFGPNASLDVGGSVTFTTANYLRLTEINGAAGVFHADTALSSILTSAPVTAFGFLTPTLAAIAVQGSRLSAANGEALSLVSGNQGFAYANPDTGMNATVPDGITITDGKLTASSGKINLASVASRGELSAVDFMTTPDMAMGNISFSDKTLLDVSANNAGTVRIRGGQLTISDATLSADTGNANGAPVAIDINLTGDLLISTVAVPALTARTTGSGDAGEIRILSQKLDVTATGFGDFTPFSIIDTHTSAAGKAGAVSITTTDDLTVIGDPADFVFALDSGTTGPDGGQGGNVTLSAKNIDIQYAAINTGDFVANNLGEEAVGSGGNLIITTVDSLKMTQSFMVTNGFSGGRGGNVTISAHDVQLTEGSALSATGNMRGGVIQINADHLMVNDSQLEANTGAESGEGSFSPGR